MTPPPPPPPPPMPPPPMPSPSPPSLPPPSKASFRESHVTRRWHACLASDRGQDRSRLEDAWRVAPAVPMAGTVWDAFAVFDGLGGRANGQEAAWAAAAALPQAMAASDGPAAVLRALDPYVRATGGAATAAVLLADQLSTEAWLLGAGDCSAYALAGGRPASLLPHDRAGRHLVTDCLGVGFRGGRALQVFVGDGEALLLGTDGVEEAAGTPALKACLAAAPAEAPAALEELLWQAKASGSRDDQTALLLRRA